MYNPSGPNLTNGHRYADDLEGQNDEAIDGLSNKVKMLKEVSEFARSLPFILELLLNYFRIADYWHWERGSRIDDSAEPDGAHISVLF